MFSEDDKNIIETFLRSCDDKLTKPTTCRECKGSMLYQGLGVYECEACHHQEFNEYAKVRNYIEEHSHADVSIYTISEVTGVSMSTIKAFIREGRFEVIEHTKRCLECGKPILTGRCCKDCTARQLKQAIDGDRPRRNISSMVPESKEEGEMRYLNKK